jgi:tetratricopeptide (TPR) repeat protein
MNTLRALRFSCLLSTLLFGFGAGFGAGCGAAGSGGDAPTRTRGMRLPSRAGMETTTVPREPMAPAKVAVASSQIAGLGAGQGLGQKSAPAVQTAAQDRLRAALKSNPQDHDTRLKLARRLLSTGAVALAEIELRRLLVVKTHAQAARVLLVRLLRAVYRLEEAVKLGKVHVAAHPKDVEGHKQLAMALLAWRSRQASAHQIQLAIKLAPKRADLWRILGNTYLKWRRLKKATVALERAVRLAPRNPWPLTLLGDAYWGQNRTRAAERAYRKAAGLKGGPPVFRAMALDKLGTLLVQQRRRKTARAVHDACKKMFPTLGCPYTRAALLPPNPIRMPAMRPVATY